MLALLLFLFAGILGGVATHHSAAWRPARALLALLAGVALQALLVALGPDWHRLVGSQPTSMPVFQVGLYRAGLVLLPLTLVKWGSTLARLSSAIAWLGAVTLVGSLSFPLCAATIIINDAPIAPTSDYFGALMALVPLGLGFATGRAGAQARWLRRMKHAAT